MNFAEYLHDRRTKLDIATVKEHFLELGGEKNLQISLRHFQQIEAGKCAPSEKVFLSVFAQTKASERKALVLAYFKSICAAQKVKSPIVDYLEQYLAPEIDPDPKSVWDTNRKMMIYSETQLKFLIEHPEAMRFHRELMLKESIEKKDARLPKKELERLQELELIDFKEGKFVPTRTLYRVPNYQNSSPRVVATATEYILKHLDLYLSKEGNDNQELGFAIQMVRPEVAQRALEQVRTMKKWIQSLAVSDTKSDNLVPFLYIGYAKKIDKKEL